MRRRVHIFLVLVAWFLATGSQWDVAQVFAWGRMFAGYSREMNVTAAVQRTFSGELCPVCRAVQKAKQAQESGSAKAPEAKSPGKLLEAVPLAVVGLVVSPVSLMVGRTVTDQTLSGRARATPPTPPPRWLA